jgi:DNA-binding PadR family transcriptional regulator
MDQMIRSFFLGFIKIHILYHSVERSIYGLWVIDELKRHGYTISPGTLYPILHSLESEGLLVSKQEVVEGKIRKYYRTTAKGKKALQQAKAKVRELLDEIAED